MRALIILAAVLFSGCYHPTGKFWMDESSKPVLVGGKWHRSEQVIDGKPMIVYESEAYRYVVVGWRQYVNGSGDIKYGKREVAEFGLDSGVWWSHQQGQMVIDGSLLNEPRSD